MKEADLCALPIDVGYDVHRTASGGEDNALWGRLNALLGFACLQCVEPTFGVAHVWDTPAVRDWIGREADELRAHTTASACAEIKKVLLLLMLDRAQRRPLGSAAVRRAYDAALARWLGDEGTPPDDEILAAYAATCLLDGQLARETVERFDALVRRFGVKDLNILNETMARICLTHGLIDHSLEYATLALQPSGKLEDRIFGAVGFRQVPRNSTAPDAPAPRSRSGRAWRARVAELAALLRGHVPLRTLSRLPLNVIYLGKAKRGGHLFLLDGTYRRLTGVTWYFDAGKTLALLQAAPVVPRDD